MAFMALFGWILIPMILLAFLAQLVITPLAWAAEHAGLVYGLTAAGLALNLLIFWLLLRYRKRRKREGWKNGLLSLLAVLWEAWVVFLCALFLLVRPLRFLPEDLGWPPVTMENSGYGLWEITGCTVTPSYSRTEEEQAQYLGVRLEFQEDTFTSDGTVYGLQPVPYDERVLWREAGINIPGSVVSASFEGLGIEQRKVRRVIPNFIKPPEEQVFGSLCYLLNSDTLLVYYDCMFFRAERVE